MNNADHARQLARRIWSLTEPVHAVTYFAPEARSAFEDAGLRGFWRGYFAGRSAPLGPVRAAPVIASFFNFAPQMVGRALPSVWDLISPERALEVRQAGAVAALHRLLDGADGLDAQVAKAADLLWSAVTSVDCAGRVLAAANAALAAPDEPFARLWHAATLLREHRGDGHFAAVLAADLDGCEVIALQAPARVPRAQIQPVRGWTDEEWDAAVARLADRGLLTSDGALTAAGKELRAGIEQATDAAAARPWHDAALADELATALTPIAEACARDLPFPNPIGLPSKGGAGQ
jgi:hypothetical protein